VGHKQRKKLTKKVKKKKQCLKPHIPKCGGVVRQWCFGESSVMSKKLKRVKKKKHVLKQQRRVLVLV